jgi:hypothetical protein
MALQLIRTITPLVGTLPIDTDWAGTLGAPGFAAWRSPNNNREALVLVRGYDAATDGNEIGLGGMAYGYSTVLDIPLDDGTKRLTQLLAITVDGRDLILETDLPSYAVDFYPRISTTATSVPAALRRLEFWVEDVS